MADVMFGEKKVKARKKHKCDCCCSDIKIGQEYIKKAFIQDGMFTNWKECLPCQPVIDEYFDDVHDEYNGEEICAWWQEYKCPKCENYYPLCELEKCELYSSGKKCENLNKNGRCTACDWCSDLTHYCRCEKFKLIKPEE